MRRTSRCNSRSARLYTTVRFPPPAAAQGRAMTPPTFDRLAFARRVLRAEAATIDVVAGRLDDGFDRAADLLFGCRGRVAVTGVGKSSDVGQKLVGTLNSTGTRAYMLDATRAL